MLRIDDKLKVLDILRKLVYLERVESKTISDYEIGAQFKYYEKPAYANQYETLTQNEFELLKLWLMYN